MTDLARRLPLRYLRTLPDPFDRVALHLGTADLLPDPSELLDADRDTADAVMDFRARFSRLHAHRPHSAHERHCVDVLPPPPQQRPDAPHRAGQRLVQRRRATHGGPRWQTSRCCRARRRDSPHAQTFERHAGSFWRTHYRLSRTTKDHNPSLGASRIDTLIVDAVTPLLLAVALYEGNDIHADHARGLLRSLPAKRDSVLRRFRNLGTRARSALDAQGMHQLYKTYCTTAAVFNARSAALC